MAAHAKLSPSSAHRWLNCTASIAFGDLFASTNPAAERGTYLHDVAAQLLEGKMTFSRARRDIDNDQDYEIVSGYIEYIFDLKMQGEVKYEGVEQKLIVTETCWGTGDESLVVDTTGHGIDLKTGFKAVEPEGNDQLKTYLLGLARKLKKMGIEVKEYVGHIYQPRANIMRGVTVPFKELVEHHRRILKVEEQVKRGKFKFDPSPARCQYCPMQLQCKHSAVPVDTGEAIRLSNLNPDQLSERMEQALRAQTTAGRVIDTLNQLAERGVSVTNYSYKPGRRNKHWKADPDVIADLMKSMRFSIDEIYGERKVLSPAQALALVKGSELRTSKIKELYDEVAAAPSLKHTPGVTEDRSHLIAVSQFEEFIDSDG